jgi:hypothetical protein
MRAIDIAQSRSLLLELGLYEPNVTTCMQIISNACLGEDIIIEINKNPVNREFQAHLNHHYQTFCYEAIRCMFMYGFVPWHPRKLASGDVIPAILPHGTFTWTVKTFDENDMRIHKDNVSRLTRTNKSAPPGEGHSSYRSNAHAPSGRQRPDQPHGKYTAGGYVTDKSRPVVKSHTQPDAFVDHNRKREREKEEVGKDKDEKGKETNKAKVESYMKRWDHLALPYSDNGSKEVQYVIELAHTSIDPEDVFVFDTTEPVLNVTTNSVLHASVPSPLAHLLVDYRNLRDAQIRRSHADAWNTTARIFTSCTPPTLPNSEPTNSYLYYETGSDRSRLTAGKSYMESRHRELEAQITQPANHIPSLYNLPVHHKLEQLSDLKPCEDIEFLLEKFRRDVCGLTGVPYDVAFGQKAGTGQETTGRITVTGRVFGKTVARICSQLEELVGQAYCTIYGTAREDVDIAFNPMPRLDISSVEDIKALFEIGAITPDVVAQLSEILLLSDRTNVTGKARKTEHTPEEYKKNFEDIHKAMKPPNPTANKPPKKKKKTSSK